MYKSITSRLQNSFKTRPEHQQIIEALAFDEPSMYNMPFDQHRIIHIPARSILKLRPRPEPPRTSCITERIKQYEQLLIKIKQHKRQTQ